MNVLGINQVPGMLAWTHDSAAALVKDGVLVATVEEERLNRVRHARGYPHRAVEYCLSEGGFRKEDIDVIAVSYDPYKFLRTPPWNLHWQPVARNVFNMGVFAFHKRQARREFPKAKIAYIPHHLAHAASAYRCSGFREANILTVDGAGETETFSFFIGRNGRIKKIWDIPLAGFWGRKNPRSIGLVYSRVTNFLNLGVQGEGKTMGLASYGKARYDFSTILRVRNHRNYRIERDNLARLYPSLERKTASAPLAQEHKDLAASLQAALEDSLVNLAREAYRYSGIRRFCLAGGVALNCNTNSKILSQDFTDEIFIQPAANDGGAALGAALEAASFGSAPVNFKMEHAYWGPGFDNATIEGTLREARAAYTFHENIEERAARLLAEGKVIGWFQGRAELGPRALCNRSILADPSVPGMNDRINASVKHREKWRPFAPVVAEEAGSRFFDDFRTSPFMLLTFYVKDSARQLLPAITHVDGSSRIQTINENQNPRCYTLLKEFEKLKGFPVLLNTSFNDRDEPIVCTPRDALRCYFSTGLDALVIGSFLLEK